jgi:GR25 family glycosyltransferase involved in LPS biosynthesis
MDTLNCYVINLPRAADRWERISGQLAQTFFLNAKRHVAVDGRNLPRAACEVLGADPGWAARRGEIGAFLSHAAVWEQIAADGCTALVLEDDAKLFRPDRLLKLPEALCGYHLVFANKRMCLLAGRDDPLTIEPVQAALPALAAAKHGVGGDGYLLTAEGARLLTETVRRDRFYGNLDWRLLRYSIFETDATGAGVGGTWLENVLCAHHNPRLPPAWGVVTTGVLSAPVVAAQGFPSTIR